MTKDKQIGATDTMIHADGQSAGLFNSRIGNPVAGIGVYAEASKDLAWGRPLVVGDGVDTSFQIETSPAQKAEFFVPVIFHDAVMLKKEPTSIVYVEPFAMGFHCALVLGGALIGALLVSRLRRHTGIDGRGAWGSR